MTASRVGEACASSLFGACVSLMKTMLGSGILAMPAVFHTIGYVPGVLMIAAAMALSMLGQYLLFLAAASTASTAEDASSKASINRLCRGISPAVAVAFNCAIMLKSLGVSLSYLMIIGDVMAGIGPEHKWLSVRTLWITLSLFIITPLALRTNMDSLKRTSFAGILVVLYLVGLSGYYFWASRSAVEHRVLVFSNLKTLLDAFCVFVFGFTCHQNVLPVYNDFPSAAAEHSQLVVLLGTFLTAAMYTLFACFSYFTFGAASRGNVLENYGPSPATTLARALFCLLAAFTVPLQMHPFKASLLDVLKLTRSRGSMELGQLEPGASLMAIAAVYLAAINVKDLKGVLATVGRYTGIPICYFLPALLYFRIPSVPKGRRVSVASLLMAALGVCIILASVIA